MKTFVLISLITASTAFAQSTKTDPTTRTIRETGSKNVATQDTTANAADNATGGTTKQKSKPKQRQPKKTGTASSPPKIQYIKVISEIRDHAGR
jgi:hypothetical protein